MKRCESCGFENADENKFCKKCGTKFPEKKLAKFCRFCGKEAVEGTLFCTGCGKSLEMKAEQPVTQPKQVVENKQVQTQSAQIQETKNKNLLPIIIPVVIILVALVIGGIWFVQNGLPGKDDSEKQPVKTENELQDEDKNDDVKDDETEKEEQEETETSEISQNVDHYSPIPLNGTVAASSSLDNSFYDVSALCDSNAATSWAEGVAGYGEGEYLTYNLGQEAVVYGMAILPGNLSTIDEFNSCSYPTKFEITVGDKTQTIEISTFNCDFNFSKNSYVYVDFAEPVKASEVKITIAGVYENVNSEDTCIAELRLYTYPVVGEESNFSVDAWKVVHAKAADYILPTSNIEYLTMEDLQGLTADECRIARNELYARYGRKFTDEGLKAYFEAKSWYTGTIEPDDFKEDMLNEYEIANRDLIVEYETLQGYR